MNPPRTTPTIAYATPEEFRRDQWIVRPGRGRGIVLIGTGGFLIFLCGLLLALNRSGPRNDCRLVLLIGGISIATGVYHLANRKPSLILTDAALLSTIGNRIQFRWADLARAEMVTDSNGVSHLILRPTAAEHEDIVLRIDGLNVAPPRILREIQARIAAAHADA